VECCPARSTDSPTFDPTPQWCPDEVELSCFSPCNPDFPNNEEYDGDLPNSFDSIYVSWDGPFNEDANPHSEHSYKLAIECPQPPTPEPTATPTSAPTTRNIGKVAHIYAETTTCVLDLPITWDVVSDEDEDILWGWRMELCDLSDNRVCAIRYIEQQSSDFVLCSDELTETANPAVDYSGSDAKQLDGWWAFTTFLQDDGSFERDGEPMQSGSAISSGYNGYSSPLDYRGEYQGDGYSGSFAIRIFGINLEGDYSRGAEGSVRGQINYSREYDEACQYNSVDICCSDWSNAEGSFDNSEGNCNDYSEISLCGADMYDPPKLYDSAPKEACGWGTQFIGQAGQATPNPIPTSDGEFTVADDHSPPNGWNGRRRASAAGRQLVASGSGRQLHQASCSDPLDITDFDPLDFFDHFAEDGNISVFTGIAPGMCCQVAIVAFIDECEVSDVKECCADIQYTPSPTLEPTCECPEAAEVACVASSPDTIDFVVTCPVGFDCDYDVRPTV